MEPHHTNEQPTSDLQTVITGRFNNFACELTAMIESIQFGRLQFTGDEYKAMETASRDLAKITNNIADEVKALGKRRKAAVVAEGQKLLSQAESAKLGVMASQKPKSLVLFVRNMQLFFNPPGEFKAGFSVSSKKKTIDPGTLWKTTRSCPGQNNFVGSSICSQHLGFKCTSEKYIWLRRWIFGAWEFTILAPSHIRNFEYTSYRAPSLPIVWFQRVFDRSVYQSTLAGTAGSWHNLAVQESVETGQKVTGSCSQKAQTQQTEVPDVDGNWSCKFPWWRDAHTQTEGAQEVIERAFLVPPTKLDKLLKLHPQSTARHSIILTIPIVDRVATVLISIPREDAIRFGWESSLPVIFNASPQPTFVQSTSARLTLPQFDDWRVQVPSTSRFSEVLPIRLRLSNRPWPLYNRKIWRPPVGGIKSNALLASRRRGVGYKASSCCQAPFSIHRNRFRTKRGKKVSSLSKVIKLQWERTCLTASTESFILSFAISSDIGTYVAAIASWSWPPG